MMKVNWAAISVMLVVLGGIGGIAFVEYGNIRVLQASIRELALSHRQLVDEFLKIKGEYREGRERIARLEALAHQHSKQLSNMKMHASTE